MSLIAFVSWIASESLIFDGFSLNGMVSSSLLIVTQGMGVVGVVSKRILFAGGFLDGVTSGGGLGASMRVGTAVGSRRDLYMGSLYILDSKCSLQTTLVFLKFELSVASRSFLQILITHFRHLKFKNDTN